jgi:hypothetical protein
MHPRSHCSGPLQIRATPMRNCISGSCTKTPGCTAGRRDRGKSKGGRSGQRRGAIASRAHVRRRPERATGQCDRRELVSKGGRSGRRRDAIASRVHVPKWPGCAAEQCDRGELVSKGGRSGRRPSSRFSGICTNKAWVYRRTMSPHTSGTTWLPITFRDYSTNMR